MTDSRNNKTRRGRISRSTRAIFWENLERALHAKIAKDRPDADKIRWLIKYALVSRTQAQRLLKFGTDPDDEQAPNIDTLASVAEAFGVTAAQFLTQGCKFNEQQKPAEPPPTGPTDGHGDIDPDSLHRPRGGKAPRR